jgi:hypothetical protein
VVILSVLCEMPALKSRIALLYYPDITEKEVEDMGFFSFAMGIKRSVQWGGCLTP